MAQILVVTQGALAGELAHGARTIAGGPERIETVSLGWDEDPVESERKVGQALARIQSLNGGADGVLILTDLPGGTPFNIATKFARPDRVEVLSGVSLAMLVRVCCPAPEERSLGELTAWLQEKGRLSICRYEPEPQSPEGRSGD